MPLALPPRPPEPTSPGFPWLATVAPMAGAGVLWGLTGSVLSLAFAALGPLVAVASLLDARRQGRRARRRGVVERRARLDVLRGAIGDRHDVERAAAWRRVVSARDIVEDARPFDWREAAPGSVVLGRGSVASTLRVDGGPVDDDDREVLELAARLDDAPVLVSAAGGIGVVGAPALAAAVVRALVVQLAYRCRPGDVGIAVPDRPVWSWAAALPHRRGRDVVRVVEASDPRGPAVDAAATAVIAVAGTAEELPPGLSTHVVVEGLRRALVDRRGDGSGTAVIVPEMLGEAEAASWAERVRSAAARERVGGESCLPDRLPLGELEQPQTPAGTRSTLRVAVGVVAGRRLELDLVAHGPHAIVAGTTGSGKSEFLLAWLAALAGSHPPDRVAFLLVDFKGGAAFEPIRDLPHVTGIVTDLDEADAERAVLSLRAELRHRESVLSNEGVRDIAGLGPHVVLPRLVLVVDEYQAMIECFPDLGAVVADIASRGRSLGVHLVLASQRPNGVVREQVSANCPIRVSLRVMQRADSVAVVGSVAAAELRPDTPGRGIVDAGDGRPVEFQSALVDAAALERLRRSTAGQPRARRPWVGPLPARVTAEALEAAAVAAAAAAAATAAQEAIAAIPDGADPIAAVPDGLAIGLVDEPERQRHGVARWRPDGDGHLLVVGEPGSGRSTALAAVEHAARGSHGIVRLGGPRSAQWDALEAAVIGLRRHDGPRLVLLDDLDVRFRDWPDEHRQAAFGMVETLLREGRGYGVAVAAAAGSAHRVGSGLRELFGSMILLRHPTRSDLVQAGGSGALWHVGDPPGAGQWRGRRLQLVDTALSPTVTAPPPPAVAVGGGCWAFVSSSPRADAAMLRAVGHRPILLEPTIDPAARAAVAGPDTGSTGHPLVVVGDADAWTANWALAGALREEATVVVHGGSREYRVFGAGSGLPPLLDDPAGQCWVRAPGAEPVRCTWALRVDN